MKQLYLDALRDIAIEHIPRARKIRDNAAKMPNDHYLGALYETPMFVLSKSATPAIEKAAAHLLEAIMSLSIDWEIKKTTAERKRIERCAIDAANELCTLTGLSIPWLPAALAEEPEQHTPPPPAPQQTTNPPTTLPPPGINLSTAQAAQLLNRKPQTLRAWHSKDNGPMRPVKNGRSLAWPSDEVLRLMSGWIE